ncbi:Serine/threonine protein kinase [Enhygromyxa salina]|uniref:Serine/threonine protein kinase n=1 Tax=Enhygromyxa salina TaxID=215803 RepID=A0A0C2D2H1_9BACT|nr:serine/threonine-protein kinase [Enhygromyxa salina]KIG17476.1 Serine/threonine protein kinase [Enhygromyxa salina]
MSPTAQELPAVGQIIADGRFELRAKLGEGGMSGVFRAQDHQLGHEVALKLLLPRYLGRAEREQRIINEGAYLMRLRGHPNIVEISDCGRLRDTGWPWVSTELLRGEVLDWLLVRNRIGTDRVLDIARQVAAALARCHRDGVVHRDTTPANLFVLEDGSVKLFDFSHAGDVAAPRLRAGALGRLTGLHDTPGTLGYMSPEQAAKASAESAMDVFGFGALLFELITRRNPFRQFNDRDEFIRAQREAEIEVPPIHAWAYEVPEELAVVVHDCTRRAAADRPSIFEVIERLAVIDGPQQPSECPARTPDPSDDELYETVAPRGRRLVILTMAALVAAGAGWTMRTVASISARTGTRLIAEDEPEPVPAPAMLWPEAAYKPIVAPAPAKPNSCDGAQARGRAAFEHRQWRDVLAHTRRNTCWSSKSERVLLRSTALLNLGRWAECTKLTAKSRDPQIRSLADACESAAELNHPEPR